MDALLTGWWRLLASIGRLERLIGVVLMATIVVSITVQVITRYAFGQPLVWVEELAGYCFLWGAFLGAALGAKELRHIRIDTFVSRMPSRRAAGWRVLVWTIVAACCLIIAVQAWDIMEVESRSKTISLPVDLPRHLFYSVPLFTCTLSIVLTAAYMICAELAHGFTGRPVDALVARLEREHEDLAADAQADEIAEQLVRSARSAGSVAAGEGGGR